MIEGYCWNFVLEWSEENFQDIVDFQRMAVDLEEVDYQRMFVYSAFVDFQGMFLDLVVDCLKTAVV